MDEKEPVENHGLGKSARASLLWGGMFTLLRDVAQFGCMLILVRLLSPEDYGTAALAQSIIGLIAVASFGTFVLHTLQLRDPDAVDWQAHFTAATVINSGLFLLTLVVARLLWFSESYHNAALPLAGLATLFLVEIPGSMRHRMLETRHEWKRFRLLLIIGTLLAMGAGLMVALIGGGVWALVIQPPLLGLPAAIDLFANEKWRPNWSWSWPRYRDTAKFGLNRMASGAVFRGRLTVEQAVLAKVYDLGALGVFTRAVGLATLIAGRIGSVAMMSLYPVVTRAERGSRHFQRISGLVLRGVSWTTIPSAVFLALCAEDIVALLYGPKWMSVAPLLPLAVAGVALVGITSTLSSLLLASNEVKISLLIDVASATSIAGLAFWLVPIDIKIYLAGLAVQGTAFLLITLVALVKKGGLERSAIIPAFFPAAIACSGASLAVLELLRVLKSEEILQGGGAITIVLRLFAEAIVFAVLYLLLTRLAFPRSMQELLEVVPGGRRISKSMRFR